MTTDSTNTDDAPRRDASACNEGLGPLPPYVYGRECGANERVWTEAAMRAYAAQERAAERDRWERILRDRLHNTVMSRYASTAECVAARDVLNAALMLGLGPNFNSTTPPVR